MVGVMWGKVVQHGLAQRAVGNSVARFRTGWGSVGQRVAGRCDAGAAEQGEAARGCAVWHSPRKSHSLAPWQTLMLPQCDDEAALPPPLHPPPTPPATAAAPAGVRGGCGRPEPWEEAAGVDAMLREVSEKCRAALRSLGGSPGSSPGGSPTAKRPRPAPRLHGAFRGLRTGRTAPRPDGVGVEGDGSMRAALGEAGSIRTLAFPQGNAFTLRTAAGGYRFRWVPR